MNTAAQWRRVAFLASHLASAAATAPPPLVAPMRSASVEALCASRSPEGTGPRSRPDRGLSTGAPSADIGPMRFRIQSTFSLAVAAFCLAAPAQQKPQPAPSAEAKPTVRAEDKATPNTALDREVESMREKVADGKTFRSHVRVTVRLKNGNRVQGIVKDGFVVERIDGIRFVSGEANDEGSGVRIYTYNGRRNYIFLAFSDMEEYRINARLSSSELAAYERRVKEDEEKKRKALMQQLDQPTAAADSTTPTAEPSTSTEPVTETAPKTANATKQSSQSTEEKKGGVEQELQTFYALLQSYPPAQGWDAARRDEIKRRFAVVGARPTASEQKFVDQFEQWQRACELLGAKPVTQDSEGSGAPTTGSRTKKSRH